MKSLNTLVKLNKTKLDKIITDKRKAEIEQEKFILKKQQLLQNAQSEIKKYHNTEFAFMLDQYLHENRKKVEQIDVQIKLTEERIKRYEEEMILQFAELKKFEIALNNRKRALAEKIRRDEDKLLDEFNSNKFARENKQ